MLNAITRPWTLCAAIVLAAGVFADAAEASRPWPRTIEGCVAGGVFVSNDGFPIRVHMGGQPYDLSRFEGLQIRYNGNLLPGDRYNVQGDPTVLGRCRNG